MFMVALTPPTTFVYSVFSIPFKKQVACTEKQIVQYNVCCLIVQLKFGKIPRDNESNLHSFHELVASYKGSV
jgi:hypothetical protein